jgi:thiamine-monophosphate kinase
MCDLSDGLLADVAHVARASGVVVALERVPLLALSPGLDPVHVLTGGEDHGLVAALPPGTPLPPGVTAVGRVEAGQPVVLLDGQPSSGIGGWEHFR